MFISSQASFALTHPTHQDPQSHPADPLHPMHREPLGYPSTHLPSTRHPSIHNLLGHL